MTKANSFFSDPLVAKIAQVVNKSLPEKPDARLLAATRRTKIAEMLRVKGAVRVVELSAALGVSEVTIRGDLQLMAEQGLLVRDRGGAIAQVTTAAATSLVERSRQNLEAKMRIAKSAAAMVESGQTILLDAGSTVFEMLRWLPSTIRLTAITNAWHTGVQMMQFAGVRLILIGGSFSRETQSTIGPIAESELSELVIDQAFIGSHSMLPDYGIADVSIEIARAKRAMLHAARRVLLLADASKWNQPAMARVAPWSSFQTLITDIAPEPSIAAKLQRDGVEILVTPPEPEAGLP